MVKKDQLLGGKIQTHLIHNGTRRCEFRETSEGLFLTSGFVYDSAQQAEQAFEQEDPDIYIYSRFSNPTVSMLESRLAHLEGSRFCRTVSSGMSAVWNSLLACTKSGDRVVASRALFGSCAHILRYLLPRYGVETVFVDGRDLNQWEDALKEKTAAVFIETPSNPTLEIVDMQQLGDLCRRCGARFIVDNVFATPIFQKPLTFGADIVTYSTTKHIDGQGRTLGGAILYDDETWYKDHLQPLLRHTGPCLSPFNAWTLLKSLETLKLRVMQQSAQALELAHLLQDHPHVEKTIYPTLSSHPQHELARHQMQGHGSTIIAIDLKDRTRAFGFINALKWFHISNNLGDTKSLVTHPYSTTHHRLSAQEKSDLGITPGLVRLSVGLEDVDDLKQDLDQALKNL